MFYPNMLFKIPNMAVKYSKSLLLFFCITSASLEILYDLLLQRLKKRHKRLLWAGFFVWFSDFAGSLSRNFSVSVSWNIRKFHLLKFKEFCQSFSFPKYKKSFPSRNFLMLEPESWVSRNIRNYFREGFFYFSSLGLQSAPCNSLYYYSNKVTYKRVLIKGYSVPRDFPCVENNELFYEFNFTSVAMVDLIINGSTRLSIWKIIAF